MHLQVTVLVVIVAEGKGISKVPALLLTASLRQARPDKRCRDGEPASPLSAT